jgi:hypothetical protein
LCPFDTNIFKNQHYILVLFILSYLQKKTILFCFIVFIFFQYLLFLDMNRDENIRRFCIEYQRFWAYLGCITVFVGIPQKIGHKLSKIHKYSSLNKVTATFLPKQDGRYLSPVSWRKLFLFHHYGPRGALQYAI